MKRKISIIFWLFGILFLLSACSTISTRESVALDPIAVESQLTITSSNAKVAQFVGKNKGFATGYEPEECYNITPDFIANNSDYGVFKYSKSTESFIMYDGEVYSIGSCFGGFGIMSMALADMDDVVNFTMKAQALMGTVAFEGDSITLNIT